MFSKLYQWLQLKKYAIDFSFKVKNYISIEGFKVFYNIRITKGAKKSTNRNKKLLIVHCSSTIDMLVFTFKYQG